MGEPVSAKLGETGRRWSLFGGSLVVSVLVVSLLGATHPPGMAIGSVLLKAGAMWPAVVYLAAGIGLGWPVRRLLGGAEDAWAVQSAAGLAVLFSLSQILGVLGLLNAATAIGVCVVGIGLLVWQAGVAIRGGARLAAPGLAWGLAGPAVAVLLVATAMPPSWLWGSEFGGFDALSYHLQLPQEWLAAGRVVPVEHNVYSYLPGYIESAFVHVGFMTLAGEDGLLGGDGWRLLACQALHAGLTLIAAWLTAVAVRRLAVRGGAAERGGAWAGAIAGGLMVATPWAVVVGSLAYNEGGVNAMFAGALVVCAQGRVSPIARGGLVGLLVGVACGFKPTALFMVGAPAGMLLLYGCRVAGDSWAAVARGVVVGAAVGVVALSPWLVRNWSHGRNPVFPFATEVFGSAHWSEAQVERYAAAHSAEGERSLALRRLVWSDPEAGAGTPTVGRFRGLANPQWGLGAVFVVGMLVVLVLGRARGFGLVLVAGFGAQTVWWALGTHMQSRFLLPMLPMGAVAVGVGLARLRVMAEPRPDGRAAVALLGGVMVVVQTGFLLGIYSSQRGGQPGQALPIWPTFFAGAGSTEPASTAAGWSGSRDDGGRLVYLLGDSTPLYFGWPLLYHTTYDRSPMGELMREHPGDPVAWAAGLREIGVGWVLVSEFELRRLQESGWYDPLVTPESAWQFAEALGGPVRAWPDERRYVVRIPAAGEALRRDGEFGEGAENGADDGARP